MQKNNNNSNNNNNAGSITTSTRVKEKKTRHENRKRRRKIDGGVTRVTLKFKTLNYVLDKTYCCDILCLEAQHRVYKY